MKKIKSARAQALAIARKSIQLILEVALRIGKGSLGFSRLAGQEAEAKGGVVTLHLQPAWSMSSAPAKGRPCAACVFFLLSEVRS